MTGLNNKIYFIAQYLPRPSDNNTISYVYVHSYKKKKKKPDKKETLLPSYSGA